MITVAVVGACGYVGSALCVALAQRPNHEVIAVTRANYRQERRRSFDILINAAMPSRRFWAKMHPNEDFEETVRKTSDLLYGWRYEKFVQISTLSARCQLDTVYGRQKAAAETLCAFGKNLIVRLGPMYSEGLTKGVLIDMLQGRTVYVAAESRYAFSCLGFVSAWIADHLERSGVAEVGARNAVSLQEVAEYLGVAVEFIGDADHQEIENPEPGFPDAREVFRFLDLVRAKPGWPISSPRVPGSAG